MGNMMSNVWAAIIMFVLIIAMLAAASPSEARRGADDRCGRKEVKCLPHP